MRGARITRLIVPVEVAGFALVIAVVWLDELLDLPRLLFHAAPTPFRLSECVLESSLTLVLGATVVGVTRWVLRRIAYLESWIVLCAWCRRVRLEREWLPFEAFVRRHNANTSHGLCDECAAQLEALDRRFAPP